MSTLSPWATHYLMQHPTEPESYKCSVCHGEIDSRFTDKRKVKGYVVCSDCCDTCALCGEWLDDELAKSNGPTIRYSEWANDGRLCQPLCALCAGSALLGVFAGDPHFDAEVESRETIAAVVAAAFPKAGA